MGPNLVQVKTDTSTKSKCFVPNLNLPGVFELSYYSNTVISVFLLESVLGKKF